MNTNSIGSFLAALRKANGMTQKQLAEKLNVSDKAVSRWERDETAPDLSLIPVLAELYGITSDEILRGQRADPSAAPTPQAEEKSKKRLQFLLNRIKTSYQTRSLISCMIAATGLIAAMIPNLGFNRAYLGFLCGAVFFVAAAVCQTIFLIQSSGALQNEDFDPDLMQQCRHHLLHLSQWIYSVIAVLFAFTLPLLSVPDAYWGLTIDSWLVYGIGAALAATSLCLLVCRFINGKLSPRPQTAEEKAMKFLVKKMNLFQLGALALAAILLLVAPLFDGNDPDRLNITALIIRWTAPVVILFSIVFFFVFKARFKNRKQELLLPGIRNLLLSVPTILTANIHSSVWVSTPGSSQHEHRSFWSWDDAALVLVITMLIFALFHMIQYFLDRKSTKKSGNTGDSIE